MDNVIIKNKKFSLTLSRDCVAQSLIFLPTGEECLSDSARLPLFSVTEARPYDNEIKLSRLTQKVVFNANRVRREGNRLTVGFESVSFEAIIEIAEKDDYVAFNLVGFNVFDDSNIKLCIKQPPLAEIRLIQLPIKKRERFGQWLNVSFDDRTAICVLATSPYERINANMTDTSTILTADASDGIKLINSSAALIVSETDRFLDAVDSFETDHSLPRGVKSRRSGTLNSSIYWVDNMNPDTADEHISYAKKGGFSNILMYYTSFFKEGGTYELCGNYDFNEKYPNGLDDIKQLVAKVKAAGIRPGLHFLHTHIGKQSRYITPHADHRLNLTTHFTLAKPLDTSCTEVFVEEDPEGSVMHEKCRILNFGGELIGYEGYSTEYPYKFYGCRRGEWNTEIIAHPLGQIGGILDVSGFGATSVYINQNSGLQEEIAEKLASVYNCGFEFVYFDGSEGTNPPFDVNVPLAQYRVYKKFQTEPLFCEGAARGHFSWHMLSGGNAFDTFPSESFKKMVAEHPMKEAPIMANDFTRVNFGWWKYYPDTQPDWYEFSTSRAAAWDCPVTLQVRNVKLFSENPRNADVFETIRRWEDIRLKKLLREDQKIMLRNPAQEHTLLINERSEYELVPYREVKTRDENIRVFVFERNSKSCAVCWHKTGNGILKLPLACDNVIYEDALGKTQVPLRRDGGSLLLPLENKRYLSAECAISELVSALSESTLL